MYTNPSARSWTCKPAPREVREFHAGLPGYQASPLIEIARRVFVKDESDRFGLPAFTILGASWAIQRALTPSIRRLVAATDGNHGRAVARIARERGLEARIVIPRGVSDEAVAAIAAEGAEVSPLNYSSVDYVRRLPISYDEAVEHARLAADEPGSLLIQDTSWPGYGEIPQSIATATRPCSRNSTSSLTTSRP